MKEKRRNRDNEICLDVAVEERGNLALGPTAKELKNIMKQHQKLVKREESKDARNRSQAN